MTGSNIFSSIIIVIFLGLTASCSQHVKLSPRRCVAPKAFWSVPTDTETFEYKHQIRTDGEYTLIKRIIEKNNRNCGDLDNISLTHKYTWADVIWNFIPFTGRSTLLVRGSSSAPKIKNSKE